MRVRFGEQPRYRGGCYKLINMKSASAHDRIEDSKFRLNHGSGTDHGVLNQSPTAYHGRGHDHGIFDTNIGADGGAVADDS